MPPTTRRTRAHPSPTGLKSLEMTTKKKRTPKTTTKAPKRTKQSTKTKAPAVAEKPKPDPIPDPLSPVLDTDPPSTNFPTSPDAFGISDDEDESQPNFAHAIYRAESEIVSTQQDSRQQEEEEEEEEAPMDKAQDTQPSQDEQEQSEGEEDMHTNEEGTQDPPSTPTPSSNTASAPSPARSSWTALTNLTAILSPRNLLRTPLSFWARRQHESAQTGQSPRLDPPTTPTTSKKRNTKQAPATISHPVRTRPSQPRAGDSNTIKAPRTIDSKRAGRRPDSHLPLHLRGCLYRDLPKEWQARSPHMRPVEETPKSSEPSEEPHLADTPSKPGDSSKRKSPPTLEGSQNTAKRMRRNTNPDGTFIAPTMDQSDDEDATSSGTGSKQTSTHQQTERSFSPTRTPIRKQPTYLTPTRQTSPEKLTDTPASSFYESEGRTYSKIIYPKKTPDFKPTFAVPELDSDDSDEDEEDEEIYEAPSKQQQMEQTPDNRLNEVRQKALRHASKVPSHLSQVQIMSPVVVTSRFSQKILDAYANLRLPIVDQDLIEIVENWDYTPHLMKFRKRKLESWVDPDEDEMRRQGIME